MEANMNNRLIYVLGLEINHNLEHLDGKVSGLVGVFLSECVSVVKKINEKLKMSKKKIKKRYHE